MAALAAACQQDPAPAPAPAARAETPPSSSGDPPDATPAAATLARAATRCSECHGEITDQWRDSAHARAATGELYLAMLKDLAAGEAERKCDRCHRPLATVVDPELPVVAEGVTCDVCHSVSAVELGEREATFTLSLGENIKFGPYCDARDHYFHRMGCSPLHTKSELCAGCHVWDLAVDGHALPVFTEYREWKQGGEADVFECQDCHMEAVPGEVAAGWDPRPHVNHHGLLGGTGTLRQQALELDVDVRSEGSSFIVRATLKNTGAAHYVPSGLPERRITVGARLIAPDGTIVERNVLELGRRLVDAQDRLVPFYRATREAEDTRIAPGGTREVELALPKIPAGAIEVSVAHVRLAHEIAALLDVSSPETTLVSGRVEIRSGRPKAFIAASPPTKTP